MYSFYPTEEQITQARAAIAHRTDGPVTSFVLLARACEACRHAKTEAEARAYAEALAIELRVEPEQVHATSREYDLGDHSEVSR